MIAFIVEAIFRPDIAAAAAPAAAGSQMADPPQAPLNYMIDISGHALVP
jgi:hypothetical protein